MYSTVDKEKINLSVESLLDSMGYNGAVPETPILDIIEKLRDEALEIFKGRYSFRQFEGEITGECLKTTGEEASFDIGKIIASCLQKGKSFFFFVATAGIEIQHWIDSFKGTGEMLELYIADNIGSTLVEEVADYMQKEIKARMLEQNLNISNRYSPGYCGWNIEEQQILFSLMQGNTCDVSLTPSSLMYPIKSVSGVIGVGEGIKYMEYGCGICTQKNCFRRKADQKVDY